MGERDAQRERLVWVDIAKGMAIALVVLGHAAQFGVRSGAAIDQWQTFTDMLRTLRMPLFFLASGLFAMSALRRSWSDLITGRLLLLAWVFLLWSVIRSGYLALFPAPFESGEAGTVGQLLLAPVWPVTGMWYLHVLIVFFVVAKLMHGRVHPAVQIAPAAVLSALVFAGVLWPANFSYKGMAMYFCYFLIGCHLGPRIKRLASQMRVRHFLALGVLYVVAVGGSKAAGYVWISPFAFGVSLVAVSFGVAVAVQLSRLPGWRPLAYFGRNTLPVYVAHLIPIAALLTVFQADLQAASQPVQVVAPLVICAVALGVSLLLHRLVAPTPLRYLFETPPVLVRLAQRALNRPATSLRPVPPPVEAS